MTARVPLPETELNARVAGLPGWEVRDGALFRELRFRDFVEAFSFMTAVALIAEKRDHHPEWTNVYNRLTIRLWTHDANGITEADAALAAAISALHERHAK
jgi:4a-hydroxytetrahydrobiopterin dehydratase